MNGSTEMEVRKGNGSTEEAAEAAPPPPRAGPP